MGRAQRASWKTCPPTSSHLSRIHHGEVGEQPGPGVSAKGPMEENHSMQSGQSISATWGLILRGHWREEGIADI